MMQIAIIGLGHIGRIHVAALSQTEGLELVAGCDNDAALTSVLPRGVQFFGSHNKLLASGGFDTVMVATPNRTHNAIARDVLALGYHVIVEKPAAGNLEELLALEHLAAERGRHVYYAFHAASAFEVDALVAHLAEQGEGYGPMTAFYSRFYDPYIDEKGRLSPHAQSLDECWSDSGVNALSVLDRLYPLDRLRPIFCRQSGWARGQPGILSASVGFGFPVIDSDSAGFGLIDTAWDQGLNYKATTLCFGHSGWWLQADHSAQTITAWGPRGETVEVACFDGDRLLNHYMGVFADYRDRVRRGVEMNNAAAVRIHEQLFAGQSTS